MKDKNSTLWIFLHIPKTAGMTFRKHIENKFKAQEILRLDNENDPWRTGHDWILKRKNLLWKHLESLPEEMKSSVKLIYGHFVPYGVHEYFKKPAKYFTFFRNPIDRTISIYNHLIDCYKSDRTSGQHLENFRQSLLINNKIPPFNKWLKSKHQILKLIQMTHLLHSLGYCDSIPTDDSSFEKVLQKFNFSGILENFNEDALYLYHELGVRKFYEDQYISTKQFSLKNDPSLLKEIQENVLLDNKLYEFALQSNRHFKENTEHFNKKVKFMNTKKEISFSFIAGMKILYRISAKMRHSSIAYSKSIDYLKKLCRI